MQSNGPPDIVPSIEELQRQKLYLDCQKLQREMDGFDEPLLRRLGRQVRANAFTIIAPAVVVFLTFGATMALEVFRNSVETERQKAEIFTNVTSKLGHFVFMAELMEEFYRKNWTSNDEINPITSEYNQIVTSLRISQFSNRAMMANYWSDDMATQFEAVMQGIAQVDEQIHGLNEERSNVIRGDIPRASPSVAARVAKDVAVELRQLTQDVHALVSRMASR